DELLAVHRFQLCRVAAHLGDVFGSPWIAAGNDWFKQPIRYRVNLDDGKLPIARNLLDQLVQLVEEVLALREVHWVGHIDQKQRHALRVQWAQGDGIEVALRFLSCEVEKAGE